MFWTRPSSSQMCHSPPPPNQSPPSLPSGETNQPQLFLHHLIAGGNGLSSRPAAHAPVRRGAAGQDPGPVCQAAGTLRQRANASPPPIKHSVDLPWRDPAARFSHRAALLEAPLLPSRHACLPSRWPSPLRPSQGPGRRRLSCTPSSHAAESVQAIEGFTRPDALERA